MNTLLYDNGDVLMHMEMDNGLKYSVKVVGSTRIRDVESGDIYKNRHQILKNRHLVGIILSGRIYTNKQYKIEEHNWAELSCVNEDDSVNVNYGIIEKITVEEEI